MEAKKKNTAKDKLIKRIAETELEADAVKVINLVMDLYTRKTKKKN